MLYSQLAAVVGSYSELVVGLYSQFVAVVGPYSQLMVEVVVGPYAHLAVVTGPYYELVAICVHLLELESWLVLPHGIPGLVLEYHHHLLFVATYSCDGKSSKFRFPCFHFHSIPSGKHIAN